jgi:carbon-monoxide dehydrogenase large subunit
MHYSEAGQPLTGSLLDYPLPHARDMLEIRTATMQTLSPTNALGLKGIGELPTVACPVALVNAAVDALSGTNVQHLDAPLTTEKLWRVLHGRAS